MCNASDINGDGNIMINNKSINVIQYFDIGVTIHIVIFFLLKTF